jgi:[ribosomal protein S5]-alanine N-acetyltransferase
MRLRRSRYRRRDLGRSGIFVRNDDFRLAVGTAASFARQVGLDVQSAPAGGAGKSDTHVPTIIACLIALCMGVDVRQGIETIETARLLGRALAVQDLSDYCRLLEDKLVAATLGGVRSRDETERYLQLGVEHWRRHGFGIWTFRDRTDGRFVGRAGLRHSQIGGREEIELLYALLASEWDKGFATEIACALTALAEERLGLESIIAFTRPTNRRSRRVMEKAGLVREGDIIFADETHVLYRWTRPASRSAAQQTRHRKQ